MKLQKPFFLASNNEEAQKKKESLEKKFGANSVENADVIVVLGGDGFMLEAIKKQMPVKISNISDTFIYLLLKSQY